MQSPTARPSGPGPGLPPPVATTTVPPEAEVVGDANGEFE